MDSFIDLMGNLTFTKPQIRKRLLALERQRYSTRDEQVLNRIASGISLGIYTPSAPEQQQITDFSTFMGEMVIYAAQIRTDNQLLKDTVAHEQALLRLARPLLADTYPATITTYDEAGDPVEVPNPLIIQDDVERAEAQATIDGISAEVLSLYELRSNQ